MTTQDEEYRRRHAEAFRAFQKTRRWDDSLTPDFGGRALVYLDQMHIEETSNWAPSAPRFGNGRWYLHLGAAEHQSDRLLDLEWILYDDAVMEGYLDGKPAALEEEDDPPLKSSATRAGAVSAKAVLTRQITSDFLSDAEHSLRVAMHVREAVALGLAVVEVQARHPDEIGQESSPDAQHRGGFRTVAVSGDHHLMIDWLRCLANLGAAYESYEFDLPPWAGGQKTEEGWGEFFTDRLDTPAVRVNCCVCDEEQWAWGLPG